MNLVGHQLGKYDIVERLGQDGMAEVFKAFQPNIERFVAIKVMHKHLATQDEFVERFCCEAKGMGQCSHHNIVGIIDFEIEDDIYYIVLDYIKGQTLRAHLKKHGILPPCEALYIMAQLADALVYAHEQGIIHRDIKPDNIILMDDRLSSPVLTNFGLARILGSDGITVTGTMIGTPPYISPEAKRGEKIDARSDIYSLGVILYEMVVGLLRTASSPDGMILKQLHDPLPAPREVNPDLPEVVEQLLKRAMAKERKERFQSASELYQAIQEAASRLNREDASLTDGQYIPTSLTRRLNNTPSPKIPSEPAEMRRSLSGTLGASLIVAFLTVQLLLLFPSDDKKQKASHTSLVTASTPMRTLTVPELEQMRAIALADASATTAPTAEARDDVTSQVAPATTTALNKVPATSTPSTQQVIPVQPTEVPPPAAPSVDSVVPQESATPEPQEPTQTAAATATQIPQPREVGVPIEAAVPPQQQQPYEYEAADNNSDESQRADDKEDEENEGDNSGNNGRNNRADGGGNHHRDDKKDGPRKDEDKRK